MTPSKTQIDGILRRHLPRGWKLRVEPMPDRGIAEFKTRTLWLKYATDVFAFLHEVGHVRCAHWGDAKVPRHVQEYEAERYAIHVMRAEGLRVPHREIRDAKDNVRDRVREDEYRQIKIDPKIRRWCK